MSLVLWGGEGSWGKYWNQRVSGFKVINLFDSDWRRWHRVNYSAKGHQAFLMGLCREGWVIRTCSLLWLIHTRGPDRPTVMQAPLWTNCHVSGWPWSGNTDRWDAFYMLLPSSSSGLVKPGRLEKNKVKETAVLCQIQLPMAGLESRPGSGWGWPEGLGNLAHSFSIQSPESWSKKSIKAGTWVTDSYETMQCAWEDG